jgi:hypothetical protein
MSACLTRDLLDCLAIIRDRDRELAVTFREMIENANPDDDLRRWLERLPGMPVGMFLREVRARTEGVAA